MRPHTLAAVATLLALTGCGGSSSGDEPAATATSPKASTPAPKSTGYDPEEWDFRIGLIIEDLDAANPTCRRTPSSSTCAAALKKARDELKEMDADITSSGHAVLYPATTDHLKTIFEGHDNYVSGGCEGDPAADEFGSDCRVSTAQVTLGVATLQMKMALDG